MLRNCNEGAGKTRVAKVRFLHEYTIKTFVLKLNKIIIEVSKENLHDASRLTKRTPIYSHDVLNIH